MREVDKIYTHDEASLIVELFENILSRYDIVVPSPEDDERDSEDMVGLYGSVYSELMESVESSLIDITERTRNGAEIVTDIYSGTI